MTDVSSCVIYQIYPKSFYDSDGDGRGDIRGITQKLGYLKMLGVDLLWLTPVYPSPQRDNGYDVADYCAIDERMGTMKDMEELICRAGQKNIGIMMDMVFNHTSSEHPWFQKALAGEKEYQDYYYFVDGEKDAPPTNWKSKFSGPAWEYVPSLGKWYLHLFDKSQPDLNWNNPKVREELKNVIRFWKKKGIKGFRFDVINLISKPKQFKDDLTGDGRKFYTDGPDIHRYLKELTRDTGLDTMVTVGEMSSTSLAACKKYSDPKEKELSMCFQFHHLKVDYKNGDKWALQDTDIEELKSIFKTWQEGMQESGSWNALFWDNHDQPRIVSRLGSETTWWKESAKMLALCIHFMRGTPYIFQGDEIGMLNPHYKHIEEYRDVESIKNYHRLVREGMSEGDAIHVLQERSRDNGRSPMQWNKERYAGFSAHEPWIGCGDTYQSINVDEQLKDRSSVLQFYRRLIRDRKEKEIIQKGEIHFQEYGKGVLAYERVLDKERLLVLCNFTDHAVTVPDISWRKDYRYQILECSYTDRQIRSAGTQENSDQLTSGSVTLRPYEGIAFLGQERSA